MGSILNNTIASDRAAPLKKSKDVASAAKPTSPSVPRSALFCHLAGATSRFVRLRFGDQGDALQFEHLWRNMDDINVKFSDVTDLVNHQGVKNPAFMFDASYKDELKRTVRKEAVVWHNHHIQYEAIDNIIRNFSSPGTGWRRFWDPNLPDAI